MTEIPEYRYQPLANDDNTRFIRLYPAAHFDDPIHVDIVEGAYDVSKIHDTVSYEALSYAWGSGETSAYIFVGPNSRLRVRRNVTQILRYLRDGISPGCAARILWIDVMYINQTDDEEKGKQVTMMGNIYACALSVLIWTGKPGCDLQALQRSFKGKGRITTWTSDEIARLMQFFGTGWFTRRWVVQEIMHARQAYVISGNGTMQWQEFRSFVMILKNTIISEALTPPLVAILHHLCNLTAVRSAETENSSLRNKGNTDARTNGVTAEAESMTTLLTRYYTTKCADDRDRIYALRSLSSTSISVDYQVSANELYVHLSQIEVVRYPMAIMSCAGSFGVFAASWIPDWRLPMRYSPFQSSLRQRCPPQPVGGSLVTVANSLLMIQASFGGVVGSVVDPPGPRYETEDKTLYRWGKHFIQHYDTGTSEQKSMDVMILHRALRAIPIEDDVADSQLSPDKQEPRTRWEKLIRSWNSYDEKSVLSRTKLLFEAYKIGLAHTKRGRTCFFTSTGLFGIGPDTIQIGDCVVNMPGCDSMMALRPRDIEQNIEQMYGDMGPSQYPAMTVVGDCWIPELVKSNRQNTTSNLRTFHIV